MVLAELTTIRPKASRVATASSYWQAPTESTFSTRPSFDRVDSIAKSTSVRLLHWCDTCSTTVPSYLLAHYVVASLGEQIYRTSSRARRLHWYT